MIQSRGFIGRRGATSVTLPPGQYLTQDFPVLSAGPTPHLPLDQWDLTIDDGTNVLRRWNWKSFRELPTENITVDIHCVTRWSKVGTAWEGVSLGRLLDGIVGDASFALVHSYGGYTTNLPLEDLMDGRGLHSASTARIWSRNTGALPGCSSRTCTSGRARNGRAASRSWITTSQGSGSAMDTTTTETHGGSSGGTQETEVARWQRGHTAR